MESGQNIFQIKCSIMKVSCFIIVAFVGLFFTVQADERCCEDVGCFTTETPFEDMPLPQCLDDITPKMKMYTRNNKKYGETLTRCLVPEVFNKSNPTVFLVHGYIQGAWAGWMTRMKNAYLRAMDCNVIIVDWFFGSLKFYYPQAASNTRTVGKALANVSKTLVEEGGADQQSLWCVGHSLGAHLCGHSGAAFKLGRITGLDPAGPWFERKNLSIGLNSDCADFVDVIHTHGAGILIGLGTLRPLGHVDFYPNGGQRQPACLLDPLSISSGLTHDGFDPAIACSHNRVLEYWIEAITADLDGCHFNANQFCYEAYNVPGACFNMKTKLQEMGPNAIKYPKRGIIYLRTNSEPPWCRG